MPFKAIGEELPDVPSEIKGKSQENIDTNKDDKT